MNYSLPIDTVLGHFVGLSGVVDSTGYTAHCALSADALMRAVREDADINKNINALCYAAGCMAFYRYTLGSAVGDVTVFKAGDVSIQRMSEKSVEYARMLLENALLSISDLLSGRGVILKAI